MSVLSGLQNWGGGGGHADTVANIGKIGHAEGCNDVTCDSTCGFPAAVALAKKAKATVLHGSGCIHLSAGSLASARQCFNEALELNRLLRGELAPNGEPPHQVAANLKGLQYAAQLVDADGDGC